MALENSNNFFNAVRGVQGLFGQTNKARRSEDDENIEQEPLPEFKSTLSDEEIISLTAKWISDYDNYSKEIKQQQKDNLNYWVGRQFNEMQTAGTRRPLVDNLLFEALETFLPIATRGNPEANVVALNASQDPMQKEAADKLAKDVQNALADEADRQRIRMILKGVTRDWAIYLIGCAKIQWNAIDNQIDTEKVLPSRLILDPNAKIDVGGRYNGEFLGEKKRCTASKLAKLFPDFKKVITAKVDTNMGTKVTYIEWWTPRDVFFMLDSEVLGKYKNPHWNYSGEADIEDPITGNKSKEEVEGQNHFTQPEIPYLFLSIFSIGRRPHDETSLMWQNIPLQDVVNRRYQQIDRNVDSQNNGIVLSGTHFTKEQAAEAATQLSRGNPLWVPSGDIRASYSRDTAPALPSDVFRHLQDARGELRNIFGTSGSTPEGTKKEDSVRGKIMVNQLDTSRIGGGVTEYIEQFASTIFNWWVQMMYVYYTEEHNFTAADKHGTTGSSLKNTNFTVPLKISVKEGSLIPKDPLTKRNEALDLWSAQAIDPINLFERLDFPNPYETAKELLTWQLIAKGALPPQAMFPDFQQPAQSGAPAEGGIVSAEEANRNEQQPNPPATPQLSPGEQGGQLLHSVPLG